MKKNKQDLIILLLLLVYLIIIYINYNKLKMIVNSTLLIYINNVFPFLFITMIINNILLDINMIYYTNKITNNPIYYLLIVSITSGSPMNAIIIKDFLDKGIINENDASFLIAPTMFNNPLFIVNYLNLIFKEKMLISLLIYYLSNIVLFIYIINKIKINKKSIIKNNIKIKYLIKNSIDKSIHNLLNILCIILIFKITCDIILNDSLISILIKGLLEITSGLTSLININLSLKIKRIITSIILSFGSLSILMQISIILDKYNINYKYFFKYKFIQIIINTILLLI